MIFAIHLVFLCGKPMTREKTAIFKKIFDSNVTKIECLKLTATRHQTLRSNVYPKTNFYEVLQERRWRRLSLCIKQIYFTYFKKKQKYLINMEIIVAEIYSREIELLNSSSLSKYSEFFWPIYSRIRTECEDIRSISSYSVRMRENADQKNC